MHLCKIIIIISIHLGEMEFTFFISSESSWGNVFKCILRPIILNSLPNTVTYAVNGILIEQWFLKHGPQCQLELDGMHILGLHFRPSEIETLYFNTPSR